MVGSKMEIPEHEIHAGVERIEDCTPGWRVAVKWKEPKVIDSA